MASYRKIGKKWRVEVFKHNVRLSHVFATKAEAAAWAAQAEVDIISGKRGDIPDKSIGDLLTRYAAEVSISKRGVRWEQIRIKLFLRDLALCDVKTVEVKPQHLADWRDRRLRDVSAASVLREWNLLSNAFSIAVKEWRWLADNPLKHVRRPAVPPSRDRLISNDELERLIFASGYDDDLFPETVSAKVGAALLFAIETALRAGEIVKLCWQDVEIDKRYLRVRDSKTTAGVRNVPLSPEAIRLLKQVRGDNPSVFQLNSSQLDSMFRKIRGIANIEDLHFHDTRHVAITRLAKKLDVMDLARMVGHRDLKMLMVYYNASAEDIAKRL